MNTNSHTPRSNKSLSFLEELTGKKITIGNLLWSIRECEEKSQIEFAKILKISRQYLCDIEQGRRIVSPKKAADFSYKLGYSPAQFIQIAIQDELNKYGLHFDIQVTEQKDAA
jgi:transcriptional regulator with XRE-family HTH domain